MNVKNDIADLVSELMRIDGEKQLLNEEQKQLFEDYKNKLDIKSVKAAIRIAKIKTRVEISDDSLDEMIEAAESKLG